MIFHFAIPLCNPTVQFHCAIPLCNPNVQSHCAIPLSQYTCLSKGGCSGSRPWHLSVRQEFCHLLDGKNKKVKQILEEQVMRLKSLSCFVNVKINIWFHLKISVWMNMIMIWNWQIRIVTSLYLKPQQSELSSSGTSLTSWLTPRQVYEKDPEIEFVMGWSTTHPPSPYNSFWAVNC